MPLNQELMAVNCIDGPVPQSPLQDALALYEAHVKPHLDSNRDETQVRWESQEGENKDPTPTLTITLSRP